jgi:hypothetical protein
VLFGVGENKIVSIDGVPPSDLFADGNIIQSDGSGLITINNLWLGQQIVIDDSDLNNPRETIPTADPFEPLPPCTPDHPGGNSTPQDWAEAAGTWSDTINNENARITVNVGTESSGRIHVQTTERFNVPGFPNLISGDPALTSVTSNNRFGFVPGLDFPGFPVISSLMPAYRADVYASILHTPQPVSPPRNVTGSVPF